MSIQLQLGNTASCCTAKQIMYVSVSGCDTDQEWAASLKAQAYTTQLRNMQDFKLFWGITTDRQKQTSDLFYEKLGFHPFVAKREKDSRHPESGSLTMWTITPSEYKKNYDKILADAEGKKIDISEEEKTRRLNFPEFALFRIVKDDEFRSLFPDTRRLFLDETFPTGLGARRQTFGIVQRLTGGFQVEKDPFIVASIRSLTWRLVKERAHLYRKGEI